MFGSLRKRGGTIVVAAIVGAVAAGSPAVAAQVVAFAKSAGNANTVNKIGASKTPRAGMLVPLNANGKFPAAVIPASRQAVGLAGPAGTAGAAGTPGRSWRLRRQWGNWRARAKGLHRRRRCDWAKGDPGKRAGTDGTNGAAGRPGRQGRARAPMEPTEPTEPPATRATRATNGDATGEPR